MSCKMCIFVFKHLLSGKNNPVRNRTCNLMKFHGPPIPYVPCFARGFFVIQSYAVNLVVQFQYVLHFHLVFSVFLYIQWFKIWPIRKGLMSETTAPGTFPGQTSQSVQVAPVLDSNAWPCKLLSHLHCHSPTIFPNICRKLLHVMVQRISQSVASKYVTCGSRSN